MVNTKYLLKNKFGALINYIKKKALAFNDLSGNLVFDRLSRQSSGLGSRPVSPPKLPKTPKATKELANKFSELATNNNYELICQGIIRDYSQSPDEFYQDLKFFLNWFKQIVFEQFQKMSQANMSIGYLDGRSWKNKLNVFELDEDVFECKLIFASAGKKHPQAKYLDDDFRSNPNEFDPSKDFAAAGYLRDFSNPALQEIYKVGSSLIYFINQNLEDKKENQKIKKLIKTFLKQKIKLQMHKNYTQTYGIFNKWYSNSRMNEFVDYWRYKQKLFI